MMSARLKAFGACVAAAGLGLAASPSLASPLTVSSAVTPTVAQLLDAANAQYLLTTTPPTGLTVLMNAGKPVTITDDTTGLEATAYVTGQKQVVIGYQGTTGGEHLITNPAAVLTQIGADVQIYAQTISPAEREAATFAASVVQIAQAQGITKANVFVTGHSLGGIEAAYVAQQLGLGGIGFEPTGIPKSATTTPANPGLFANVVTYGDPVGNYASDVKGEQPFAPAYAPDQTGTLPHYGRVVSVGTPSDQVALTMASMAYVPAPLNPLVSLPGLAILLAEYHLPGVQAHDLAVSLSPYSPIVDGAGDMNGNVTMASALTIPQFVALYAQP